MWHGSMFLLGNMEINPSNKSAFHCMILLSYRLSDSEGQNGTFYLPILLHMSSKLVQHSHIYLRFQVIAKLQTSIIKIKQACVLHDILNIRLNTHVHSTETFLESVQPCRVHHKNHGSHKQIHH